VARGTTGFCIARSEAGSWRVRKGGVELLQNTKELFYPNLLWRIPAVEVRQHTLIFIQFPLPVRVRPTSFDFVFGFLTSILMVGSWRVPEGL